MMRCCLYVWCSVMLLIATFPAVAGQPIMPEKIGPAWVWHVDAAFDDVADSLRFAIEERGLVITYTSHVHDMLDRTAVSGIDGSVYHQAEILFFCKVGASHALVRANPHNIVLCPFSIAVYSLQGAPERTYLSFRAPYADEKMVEPIRQLQQAIIEQTIDEVLDL